MHEITLKVGITPQHACSYLNHQKEQLLVLMDQSLFCPQGYEHLLSIGFRRSGNDIYRPQCPSCNACKSIRIAVQQFSPSRSQRRILKKGSEIKSSPSFVDKKEYYQLYEKYICTRHDEGSMYPPSVQQYKNFLLCHWLNPCFFEFRYQEKLIAVAVTDIMSMSLSAMYTFYDPDYAALSLGTLAILRQIQFGQQNNKKWLYLGYYVEQCQKMNYKKQFLPCEMLMDNRWQPF